MSKSINTLPWYKIKYSKIHLPLHCSHYSLSVGKGSVIEYCSIEERVNIGSNCIVSNLHVPVRICCFSRSYNVIVANLYVGWLCDS